MKRRTFGRLASVAAVLTLGGVGYSAHARSRNPYYAGPVSDHFDGVRFTGPGETADRGVIDLLRWQIGGGRSAWPASYPSPFADKPPERVSGLRICLVGHASILIQVAGVNILVDPVWSDRASPSRFVGPRRANPPGIAFDDLPPIDVVLVTHNHYDHLDLATIGRLWGAHRPRIVAPLGNDAIMRADDDSIRPETLDWGGDVTLGPGLVAHLTPAQHWSARGVNDRRMALWGAWAITAPSGLIYVAGDTGYGDGATFRDIRGRFGPAQVAVLPIGAYEPRWFMAPQHMNPADAVKALADLEAGQALGVHWGTFQLTNEPIDQPEIDLAAALATAGLPTDRFLAMRPGQVWEAAAA